MMATFNNSPTNSSELECYSIKFEAKLYYGRDCCFLCIKPLIH